MTTIRRFALVLGLALCGAGDAFAQRAEWPTRETPRLLVLANDSAAASERIARAIVDASRRQRRAWWVHDATEGCMECELPHGPLSFADQHDLRRLTRSDAVLLVSPDSIGDFVRAVLRRPTREGGDSSVARFRAGDGVARAIVAWAMRDSLFPAARRKTPR